MWEHPSPTNLPQVPARARRENKDPKAGEWTRILSTECGVTHSDPTLLFYLSVFAYSGEPVGEWETDLYPALVGTFFQSRYRA